jgi:DNA-binding PadR family transcriptional regulator
VSILALLAERPMHPYEMYQTLRERHEDIVVPVSVGSLYHAVSRLAEHGHVRPVTTEQVGNRPERTTYEILDTGLDIMRTRLYELLSVPTQLSQADHTGIGELHNLSTSAVLSALDARIAALDGQIAEHETLLTDAQIRNVDAIYLLYGSYATAQQHHEREWFATLRDRIQTGDLTWPTPT